MARKAARMLGITLSQVVRAGVRNKVVEMINKAVEIVKEGRLNTRTQLEMIRFLDDCAMADLAALLPVDQVILNRTALRDARSRVRQSKKQFHRLEGTSSVAGQTASQTCPKGRANVRHDCGNQCMH